MQMNNILKKLKNGISYLLIDFLGQIISAFILLLALLAWSYYSTIYAAIIVVVVGIVFWSLAGNTLSSYIKKTKNE